MTTVLPLANDASILRFISYIDKPSATVGWDFTDRFFIIDFMKKMVYPTNNTNPKLGG
jgi:hypothetical protein